eukprot:TRINITY_DN3624_c0_g1_i9.p1 TRINITY_DN3624_c0_g1~~TRINITY_DN3624_c0_g1_i9.p1  ORF type:complete len:327 (+),score=72.29 TRINITY_DN3624_c0_g1_i9:97-1077(+)
MHKRGGALYGVTLFSTFLALVWVMWSGLSLLLPETEEPVCECNPDLQLISHRGGASMAPENTMAAFRKAREITVDIQLDLAVTKDGYLVLMHDDYVDRTTDQHGLLCLKTLEEVKQLDAGSWFDHSYTNERVPTLREVFEEFGNTTRYHMDLKKRNKCEEDDSGNINHQVVSIADAVVSLVREYKLEDNVGFTVEDKHVLRAVKTALPAATILASINVLYTLAPLSSMWSFVDDSGADGVLAHFLMPMLKDLLAQARIRDKKVYIYTCLLYTSDAADEEDSVDLGGRRIIKKKKRYTCCTTQALKSMTMVHCEIVLVLLAVCIISM